MTVVVAGAVVAARSWQWHFLHILASAGLFLSLDKLQAVSIRIYMSSAMGIIPPTIFGDESS
jgi:hypothetical protein